MFPQELAEAERLVAARSDFIANAKHEAESVRRAAEERSRQLVDEQEVLRMARAQSRELLVSAETRAEELRRAVTEYADDALRRTEDALSAALGEMKNLRTRFSRAVIDSAAPTAEYNSEPPDFDIDIDL
jgi:vacuolar-type H+-ATPase subunit H